MNKLKNIHYDVWISLILLAFTGWFWAVANTFRKAEETAVYPHILLGILAAFCLILLFGGIRKSTPEKAETLGLKTLKMPLMAYVWIAFYEFMFLKLGYFIATPIFLLGLMLFLKQKNWKLLIAVTAGYLALAYVAFVLILKVKLP